jgi:transposase
MVLATRRVADGLAGVGELHVLVASHAVDPAQVAVGIETDRRLLVAALLAAGYQVYAVNPQVVGRYRGRHGSSRAKSDRGDAKVLADLVRTDRHNHRPVAGDSLLAEAVKVLARAHQSLIWARQRHVNAVRSALREFYPGAVVGALVAALGCLNQQVAALEQQLPARFADHQDAAIIRSQPGLGVVLGARVLGEFGDDPDRYQTAKGRKAFAGTAPVTRSSGLRTVVARAACNQRLVDACYLWAFAALTASPGARRCYDAHRARGATHHQELRALSDRLVGILHGCLAHRVAYQEQLAWPAS